MMNWSYFVLLLTVVFVCGAGQETEITIKTPSGPIVGTKRTHSTGDTIYEFLGIPYAKPPIGNLRFRKSEPYGNWTKPINASTFGPACFQNIPDFQEMTLSTGVSEDCLFLNIHTPRVISTSELVPVMVWIHGGGFEVGYSHEEEVTGFAMDGNVILVTINYRLGAFGFFALDHPAAKGNYALWDQKLALHWVHDNIIAFGGNPNLVTLFGESAGGYSVSLQSLIASNKGLFQRVISESGVQSRVLMRKSDAIRAYAKGLSERSKCPFDDMYAFVDCLRNLSSEEIMYFTDFYKTAALDKVHYMSDNYPVVDGELFPKNPISMLEDPTSNVSKFFRSLDFVAGTTSNEGSILLVTIFPPIEHKFNFNLTEGIPHRVACEEIIATYVKNYVDNNQQVKEKMCNFYRKLDSADEQSLASTHLLADLMFVYPTIKMLEYHSNFGARSYHYQFSIPSPNPWGGPFPSWFKGAGHGDELIYLFRPDAVSRKGKILSKQMRQYWASFAKTG